MIKLLQQYIAIDTSEPHPNYKAVVALFQKQALEDGLQTRELTLESGYPVIVITVPGSTNKPALLLNHHMDVVPALDANMWKFPPFAAIIQDDLLYGRGAQDCKTLGVIHYGVLQKIKRLGVFLERTVHMVIVPDEEVGGFKGTKEFLKHPLFYDLNIGYMLDEGMPSGNSNNLLIKIDERTPIQIKVTSKGKAGHASEKDHENALHKLIDVLYRISLFNNSERGKAKNISMHITSLESFNTALNMIPSNAYATIDVRIPSQITIEDGIALVDSLFESDTQLSYEILATSYERYKSQSIDSLLYQTLKEAICEHGLQAEPYMFNATTDARFYSEKKIQAVGFTPLTVQPNLHGIDECVSVKELPLGIEILYTFVLKFCKGQGKK